MINPSASCIHCIALAILTRLPLCCRRLIDVAWWLEILSEINWSAPAPIDVRVRIKVERELHQARSVHSLDNQTKHVSLQTHLGIEKQNQPSATPGTRQCRASPVASDS